MMKFSVKHFDEVLNKTSIGSGAIKLNVFGDSMRKELSEGTIVYGSIDAYNPVQNIQVSEHFCIEKADELKEDVSVYMDYKNLSNAVRALSKISENITITLDEKEVTLSVGKTANLSLSMVEPVELITISNEETPKMKAVVNTQQFLEGVKKGAYCYSSSMPTAKGVFIKLKEDAFEIITLDSTSMANAIVPAKIECQEELQSIYLASSINFIKSIIEQETTSLALMKNYLLLQNGLTFVLVGLLTETFPESICGLFSKINDANVKFCMNKKELVAALDVVTFEEGGKGKITFKKKGKDSFVIYSAANAKNSFVVKNSVEDFETFSLSAAILRETLDHISEETVIIKYLKPKAPLYIKGVKDNKEATETHVITPVASQE